MAEEVKLILSLEEQAFLSQASKALKATQENTQALAGWKGATVALNSAVELATVALRAMQAVTAPLIKGIEASVKAASDLNEETDRFRAVFSGIESQAESMARSLSDSFGLSQIEAAKLLGATGNLLNSFGITGRSALDMSSAIAKLSVDISAFTNFSGGASGASEILTRAVAGQTRGLIQLGVSIDDAQIKQRLLESGQGNLTGAALKQAEAQATLALIMERTTKAQGEFARSAGDLEFQQNRLDGGLQDLATNVGKLLIPVFFEFTKAAADAIKELTKFVDLNKGQFAKGIADGIIFAARAMALLIDTTKSLVQTFLVLTGGVNGWAAITLSAISEIYKGFTVLGNAVAVIFAEITKAITNEVGGSVEGIGILLNAVKDGLGDSFIEAGTQVRQFGESLSDQTDQSVLNIGEVGKSLDENAQTFLDARNKSIEWALGIEDASTTINRKLDEITSKAVEATNAIAKGATEAAGIAPGQEATGGPSADEIEAMVEKSITENQAKELASRLDNIKAYQQSVGELRFQEINEEFIQRMTGLNELLQARALTLDEAMLAEHTLILQRDVELEQARTEQRQAAFALALEDSNVFAQAAAEAFRATGDAANDALGTVRGSLVEIFTSVKDSIGLSVIAAVDGQKKVGEVFKELAINIRNTVIKTLVDLGVQYVTNAILSSLFANKAANSQIASASGVAYANAYAATTIIPIIGPALAPVVAAIAGATSKAGGLALANAGGKGFASGSDFIHETGLATIHRGERVVPTQTNADLTSFLRQEIDRGSSGGGERTVINIAVDNVIGDEKFVDDLALKISDSIEFRRVDFRGA